MQERMQNHQLTQAEIECLSTAAQTAVDATAVVKITPSQTTGKFYQ